MPTTSARILQLLSLLQARGEWAGSELAERLGVTGRTIRRDVERLRELGYTIDSTVGAAGGYRLGFGTGIPPLLLTPDEAVAVAVALRGSAVAGLQGMDETAIRALLKLQQSLPADLRQRVRAVGDAVISVSSPGPSVDVDVLTTAATAIRDHRQLRAEYTTHRGTRIDRVLEPHRIVRVSERWFLLAWDEGAADWRTLRLDRLRPRTPLGRAFVPRQVDDDSLLTDLTAGITARPYRYQLRLTVMATADEVGEHVGALRARVAAIDDHTSEVTGGGDSLFEMARWIIGLPFETVAHEPAELVPHLEAITRRAARAVSGLAPGGPSP